MRFGYCACGKMAAAISIGNSQSIVVNAENKFVINGTRVRQCDVSWIEDNTDRIDTLAGVGTVLICE